MGFPCLMGGCMVYEESYPAPSAGLPLTSFDLFINSLNECIKLILPLKRLYHIK